MPEKFNFHSVVEESKEKEPLKKDHLVKNVENSQETEMENLGKKISENLNSEIFISALRELRGGWPSIKENAITLLIKYFILNPTEELTEDLVKDIKKHAEEGIGSSSGIIESQAAFLLNTAVRKLNIGDIELDENKERIVQYFIEHYVGNGYYYHSFNSAFQNSIQEHGLDPEIREWDWSDIDEINKIFEKQGFGKSFLGWSNLNCKGKISIANDYANLYSYAVRSPEWFSQFVAGMHIPPKAPYDKEAFVKRDYNAAKNNLELFLERCSSRKEDDVANGKTPPNLTEEERQKARLFFEKYWSFFKDSKPMVALIKNEAAEVDGYYKIRLMYRTYAQYAEKNKSKEPSLIKCIENILFKHSMSHDEQIEHKILPKDIAIVTLPEYSKIYSQLTKSDAVIERLGI